MNQDKPEGVYPLNWESSRNRYPDFELWKHRPQDDKDMQLYLQRGFQVGPVVPQESASARPLMTQLLKPNGKNGFEISDSVNRLGDLFIKSQMRRRIINKVKGHGAKPPPRMTLTEHKKEIWMKRIANRNVQLSSLKSIPHGLRNKVLLDQCLAHSVPIGRALWLIKSVAINEHRLLKRKVGINKWVTEWTDEVTSFMESVITSCLAEKQWEEKLQYSLELIVNLFIEGLMNRNSFLLWIVRYISLTVHKDNVQLSDLQVMSIHFLLVKKFWYKIIKIDYLAKELSEAFLFLTWNIDRLLKNSPELSELQRTSYTALCTKYQNLTCYLFYYNSDAFIIPSSWNIVKSQLKKVIDMNNTVVSDQYRLIACRNQSLMLDNESHLYPLSSASAEKSDNTKYRNHSKQNMDILSRLNNYENESIVGLVNLVFGEPDETKNIFKTTPKWKENVSLLINWCLQKEPHTSFIDQKNTSLYKDYNTQKIQLVLSIITYRSTFCTNYANFLTNSSFSSFNSSAIGLGSPLASSPIPPLQVVSKNKKKAQQNINELQHLITEFVSNIAEKMNFPLFENIQSPSICTVGKMYTLSGFLFFITELHQEGLFLTSAYLRRLIASGVIYLSIPERTCYIHLLILNSIQDLPDMNEEHRKLLPATEFSLNNLKDGNSKSILKRLGESTGVSVCGGDVSVTWFHLLDDLIIFWNKLKISNTAEHSEKITLKFINKWPWKTEFENVLYMNMRTQLGKLILKLLFNDIDKWELNMGTLSSLYRISMKLDIVGKMLFVIVSHMESKNETCSAKITLSIMKMVFYFEKSLRCTKFINIQRLNEQASIWDNIMSIFQSWVKTNKHHSQNLLMFLTPADDPDFKLKFIDLFVNENSNNSLFSTSIQEKILTLGSFFEPGELQEFGISSYERLFTHAEFTNHVLSFLEKYFNMIQASNESTEIHISNSFNNNVSIQSKGLTTVVKILKLLQRWRPTDFDNLSLSYIKKWFDEGLIPVDIQIDYNIHRKIIMKFIANGIVSISGIMKTFSLKSSSSSSSHSNIVGLDFGIENSDLLSINNLSNSSEALNLNNCAFDGKIWRLVYDIFFSDEDIMNGDILDSLNLEYQRYLFEMQHTDVYYGLLSKLIHKKFGSARKLSAVHMNEMNNLSVLPGITDMNSIGSSSVNVGNVDVEVPAPTDINMTPISSMSEIGIVPVVTDTVVNFVDIEPTTNQDIFSINVVTHRKFKFMIEKHFELFVKYFYQTAYEGFDPKLMRKFLLADLGDDELQILMTTLNIFNLPIYQWIFNSIVTEMFENDQLDETVIYSDIVNKITLITNDKSIASNVYIGELFSYLPDFIKVGVLTACEDIYLASDTFPSVLVGNENVTELLSSIMTNCSKFDHERTLTLPDALVFSLNMGIEKLLYICHNEHKKTYSEPLEEGVKMVSKILFLHKKFLVDLIIKRSVNLQRDVLLMNLTKLYNHRCMNRNARMKNLMYDVLIMLKVLISEKTQKAKGFLNIKPPSVNNLRVLLKEETDTIDEGKFEVVDFESFDACWVRENPK